jgi:glycosyltransferase involved in cell wall biosynthesis
MKVFFLIPSLDYGGAARQLVLLAAGLPRDRFTPRVCTLGRPTPWAETLRTAGVEVEVLSWKRVFDMRLWLRLRDALRSFQPDVLHVWNLPRLWPVLYLRRWVSGARLIISAPGSMSRLDRWVVRSGKERIAVGGPAAARRMRALGVAEDRLVQIPPGVLLPDLSAPPAGTLREELGLPPQALLLAGVGPLEPERGFYDAVWALDILKYIRDDLHLVLIGRGPDRPRLLRFARSIDVAGQVHLLGEQPDVGILLRQVDLVWVPNRREGGHNAALEAMAAAKAVVAARQPGLAEIVRDGETGLLHRSGDKAALARLTRLLLDNPEKRRQLGEAGRRCAEEHFPAAALVQRYSAVYPGA